jgi:mannose-6-phosphate isomerase-like protein (cupin superfamily)
VVKVFNTNGARNMADPDYGGHKVTMLYAGDDDEANRVAAALAGQLGFEAIYLGPLKEARLLEPLDGVDRPGPPAGLGPGLCPRRGPAAGEVTEGAMRHKHLQFGQGFRVVLGDGHSQAAQMTLGPGESEGGPDNRHRGADQWLYVVSGAGLAVVNGERVELREGSLVLIQRGETHEVRNTGPAPLKTLNVYVPPAYAEGGEELPAGRP